MGLEKQNGNKSHKVGLSDEQLGAAISEMIARHVVQLSEHCHSVQVVATKLNSDGTTSFYAYGAGDIFSRARAVEAWQERAGEHITTITGL